MSLCSASDTFQIVVRHHVDRHCFVVIVATKGDTESKDVAFNCMQQIRQFVFGEWRRNVGVQEFGLHPRKLLEGPAVPVGVLEARMLDEELRAENLPFYFGLQVTDNMLSVVLQQVRAVVGEVAGEVEQRLQLKVDAAVEATAAQVAENEERAQQQVLWVQAEARAEVEALGMRVAEGAALTSALMR
jgi:hypothetical protein